MTITGRQSAKLIDHGMRQLFDHPPWGLFLTTNGQIEIYHDVFHWWD
jgi:hypothetical protein